MLFAEGNEHARILTTRLIMANNIFVICDFIIFLLIRKLGKHLNYTDFTKDNKCTKVPFNPIGDEYLLARIMFGIQKWDNITAGKFNQINSGGEIS
jgi:hypothetical protein